MLILSLLTYGLRIVARVKTSQKVSWDDYLMGLGLLLSLEPTICQYLRKQSVSNSYFPTYHIIQNNSRLLQLLPMASATTSAISRKSKRRVLPE